MATWVTDKYPGGVKKTMAGDSFSFKTPPCIFVLHSTETDSFPNYPYNKAPHVTADPYKEQWQQHQSLDRPAWALKASGVSTNSWGAIQIEIVGRAATLFQLPDKQLKWLAGLIRMLMQQTGIPIQCSVQFGGSEAYGQWPGRLTANEWYAYKGILGHQHVPGNTHWDPGDLDMYGRWLPAILGTDNPVGPSPTPLESDMGVPTVFHQVFTDGSQAFVYQGVVHQQIIGSDYAAALSKGYGTPIQIVNEYDWNAIAELHGKDVTALQQLLAPDSPAPSVIDVEALAASLSTALVSKLPPGLTKDDVEQAIREVFLDGGQKDNG